jgi:signal transduction histidine kinase
MNVRQSRAAVERSPPFTPGVPMRWSIRQQILVPLIAIQAVAVTAITITTATLAARRAQREIINRLNSVIDTLGHASFPYTASVLSQMRGLSGAHFVAHAEDGRVLGSSLPAIERLTQSLRDFPVAAHLDSLGKSPTVVVAGTRYLAVPLRPQARSRGSSLLVLYPETSWEQARWAAALPPFLLGSGALGVMVVLTSWIAHRISSRIRRVQEHVARIAAGDLEAFDPGRRSDEVQDLANSIKLMCAQLKHQQDTIRQSERARLLAQLAAGLAHQLRNALTGARMSIQLHAKRFPPQTGDKTLDVALLQLAITEEQVKGLLSLGRSAPQTHARCELNRVLEDVALLVSPSCDHAKVALRNDRSIGPIQVNADEMGLRAAVLNLTLNAIEAAGPGGEVEIAASSQNGEVTIAVADTGPGPPSQLSDRLFEPFITSKPEGVGLGLALAQRVAAEHGGRLWWTREGGRTCFRLRLPESDGAGEELR